MNEVKLGPETVWRNRQDPGTFVRAERSVVICPLGANPDMLAAWVPVPESWLMDLYEPVEAPVEIPGQSVLEVA